MAKVKIAVIPGDGIGKVEIIGIGFDPAVILEHEVRREEMRGAIQYAVKPVETALPRGRVFHISDAPAVNVAGLEIPCDVPLAGHQCSVAAGAQMFRDRGGVVPQKALIGRCPEVCTHVPDACVMRIDAGQQGRPRRTTARAVIHR